MDPIRAEVAKLLGLGSPNPELDVAGLRARSQKDAAYAAGMMGGGEEGAVRTTPLEGSRVIAGHCSLALYSD